MDYALIATPPRQPLTVLGDLADSTDLAGGPVVGDGAWLTLGEVLARLRAAGFSDSESTVRRMIDDGELESYRQRTGAGRTGHRRIKAASVEALIGQRMADPAEPGTAAER